MKTIRLWLATIATLLCSLSASAHDFEVGGIYYYITSSTDLTVAVTFRGASVKEYPEEYSGIITIPSTVIYGENTYSVTKIASSAFKYCSTLTAITLPESMTSIGADAFSGCSGLNSISIPGNVISIGNDAFSDCSGLKEVIFLDGNETLSLGCNDYDSFTNKGYGAFCDCPLENIYIGRDLSYKTLYNEQGYSPFSLCRYLDSVTIGNKVTFLSNYMFYGCRITSLHISSIEAWCNIQFYSNPLTCAQNFYLNGEPVTNLIIPNTVSEIKRNAFSDCGSLTSITIPESVTSIGEYAFSGCSNIHTVINSSNLTFSKGDSSYGGIAYYAERVVNRAEFIDDFVFHSLDGINYLAAYMGDDTAVVLPETFNGENYGIGSEAFSGNYTVALASINMSEHVTWIGTNAFKNCSSLTCINIPNGVTEIGDNAFNGCSALTNLSIGSSVSTIGRSAFVGCNEIESIYAFNPKAITCDESIFATDVYNNAILYVPSDRVFAYEKATPWNKFEIKSMKKFTVTYKVNGEAYKTIEIEYAAEITLPENPEKEGYTFIGWSEVPKTMPANDITIYGSFAINKYLVTFKIGDEVIASDSLEYGTSIVIPEAPKKEGYTFNGWGEVAKTVPAGDVTYEGNYSVNSYKLTFIVDGEVVQESSVDYGATITLPEAPEKEGYSFDGWSEIPETMPASDVVIYGTFTKLFVETVTINDSDKYFSMAENTECGSIYYFRNFSDTEWQTLYVPFEIPYEDICDDFEVAEINNVHQYDYDDDGVTDETIIEAFKITSGVLKANYPYLIRAKETGWKILMMTNTTLYATEENSIDCSSVRDKFTFTGTYSSLSSAELPQGEGYYTLIEGEWKPVTEAVTLGAFRFFLKVDSRSGVAAAEARSIRLRIIGENGEDDTTGIDNLESTDNDGKTTVIYDLQGRKVLDAETLQEGVYIINGKKVVIK